MFMKKEKPISLSPSDIWIPFVISFQKNVYWYKGGVKYFWSYAILKLEMCILLESPFPSATQSTPIFTSIM